MSSPTLPPGQTVTGKFPVTGEKQPDRELTLEDWRLSIEGAVAHPANLSFADLMRFPQELFTADIHCVTRWSQLQMTFEGVRLAEVLKAAAPIENRARFVRFTAYSDRGHDTSLPLPLAMEDCWLVHRYGGQALSPAHGYPVRVVTPSRYFYKSVKWLKSIVLLEEDQLGFWERTSAYHNEGDPWKEQRLEGTKFTSIEETERFRNLDEFGEYRDGRQADRVIVKANLTEWRPRTQNLQGLRLKACDFRNADLREVDLRGANLTLGKFQGANLENADLTGADLEGADFTGARLAGARLIDNALSATVFQSARGLGLVSFDDLIMRSPQGLLESQESYLRALGILSS